MIQVEHSGINFDIDSQMTDGYNAKATEIVNSHREKTSLTTLILRKYKTTLRWNINTLLLEWHIEKQQK